MEDCLPREIEVDIFSRLPAETLVPSKEVCKAWRGLFQDEYFIGLHLRRNGGVAGEDNGSEDSNNSTSEVSFLMLGGSCVNCQNKSFFYYGNYSDDTQQLTYKNLEACTPNSGYSLVGSCNGLICFSACHVSELFLYNDPVCLSNPMTGEVLDLPRYIIPYPQLDPTTTIVDIASGFGYAPLTKEYKAVRICYYRCKDSDVEGDDSDWVPLHVQVYTLGCANGWKTWKGDPRCLVSSDLTVSQPEGVYANGALYWLNVNEYGNRDLTMVAFDLAEEKFSKIEPPPCFHMDKPHCYQLQVLGGCLSVVHQRRGEYVDIWSLKKTNNNNHHGNSSGSWSWSREFRIVWQGELDSEYQPFALSKRGQLLFRYNHTTLSLYDPKAATVTKLMDGNALGFEDFQTVPHINSFVSIKASGEAVNVLL